MAVLRLSDRERTALLAAAVTDYLNTGFSEGELERGGPETDLYNLADALGTAATSRYDHSLHWQYQEWADREATEYAAQADGGALTARLADMLKDMAGVQ